MKADVENFKISIADFDREHLLSICVKLFEKNLELKAEKSQFQRTVDESACMYNDILIELAECKSKNSELTEIVAHLAGQVDLKNKAMFGAKTEKFLLLLEQAVNPTEEFVDESQTENSEDSVDKKNKSKVTNFDDYKNKKNKDEANSGTKNSKTKSSSKSSSSKKGYKNSLKKSMEKLPKETVYDFDPEELDKKYGKGNWTVISMHVHSTIERIPIPYYEKQIFTPVIKVKDTGKVVSELYKNELLDRSHLSPSMLASILYNKYVKGLPLHRQAFDFKIFDIGIIKQTMINWVNTLVPRYMRRICDYLIEKLLEYEYIQSDETYIKVNKDGRDSSTKSYMWVHCSSQMIQNPPIIVFCYEKTRSTEHLRNLLAEFKGYITCDAYISYQVIEKETNGRIKATGCHMHLRRYFAQALFVNDVMNLTDEELLALPETQALLKIRDIYSKENELKELDADERQKIRQLLVKPLVDDFFAYIHELAASNEVYPERLTKAINYAINQEELLKRFLDDGNIPIDNGQAERAIRSFSVGRMNWLFADTPIGAEVNSMMYTIVETAKANGANPYLYIKYIFDKMPSLVDENHDVKDKKILDAMMPWSKEYKGYEMAEVIANRHLLDNLFVKPEPPQAQSEAEPEQIIKCLA